MTNTDNMTTEEKEEYIIEQNEKIEAIRGELLEEMILQTDNDIERLKIEIMSMSEGIDCSEETLDEYTQAIKDLTLHQIEKQELEEIQ